MVQEEIRAKVSCGLCGFSACTAILPSYSHPRGSQVFLGVWGDHVSIQLSFSAHLGFVVPRWLAPFLDSFS